MASLRPSGDTAAPVTVAAPVGVIHGVEVLGLEGSTVVRAVLADLALEVEGTLALGLRVARAFDEGDLDRRARRDPVRRPFENYGR